MSQGAHDKLYAAMAAHLDQAISGVGEQRVIGARAFEDAHCLRTELTACCASCGQAGLQH